MCGISGFNWDNKEAGAAMNLCLSHRGPDASGIFAAEGITLAHQRLSIIDLSSEANQPMIDNRSVIIFNGEIYNYKELKQELTDYTFKTSSDTEVILAGYQKWGKDVVLHLNGIFSFALWDKEEKLLFVARDHMGVKPFYYFWDEKRFVFASELKSILIHDIPRKLNLEAFNDYLRVLYVPSPMTLLEGVFKLPPGCRGVLREKNLLIEEYYHPELTEKSVSYKEATRQVKREVEEAVHRQMVADVPVGVYLSGGIDSSTVLAAASKIHPSIKTFSIGFELEEGEDPEKFNRDFDLAARTASHFGADHYPLRISIKDVANSLVGTIASIDDPISNPTAMPMSHLSRFAKKEVTVVLSGNGGDELFGGYERYRMGKRADMIGSIPGAKYFLPKRIRSAIEMSTLDRLVQFEFEKDRRLGKVINPDFFTRIDRVKQKFQKYTEGSEDKTEALMLADLTSWLPDQALSLGDKMSMQGSIEERVPFLDKEIVQLSMNLPISYKVSPFETKKILKDAFRKDLPEELFHEPKRGWFSPGAKWIRRPEILSIFKEVLNPTYYEPTTKLFDWKGIEKMLDDHVEKREYNLTVLWALLTFQIWTKQYKVTI